MEKNGIIERISIRVVILLAGLVCLFFINPVYSQIQFYHHGYDSARKEAQAQSKLLLVDFRADWCKPCIEMEKTTFQDPALGSYVSSRYISIKVDVDYSYGIDLRDQFKVNQYPTILVVDPLNQAVTLRLIGFKPASILMGDLKMLELNEVEETEETQVLDKISATTNGQSASNFKKKNAF